MAWKLDKRSKQSKARVWAWQVHVKVCMESWVAVKEEAIFYDIYRKKP